MNADGGIDVQIHHATRALEPQLCRRVLRHVLEQQNAAVAELTLVLADHETVYQLNRQYLDHDYTTDVLAFGYGEEGAPIDGEIYVDLDTAAERHAEFDTDFEQEALRYAIHGLLHLLGYRDKTDSDKQIMHALEDRYLRETGVSGD